MLTEQSSAHKKSRRTLFIENASRTIAENQYWYHRTASKIK